MKPRSTISIIVCVFIPFMVAYLLSELYRNINAIAGPVIRDELGLSLEYLGLMTSLFLVAIAGAQVFTGIWLDRFGARRTVTCLLLVGALGAALFSLGEGWLLIGRFLIGIGMAGCWTAAFMVNSQWWPPERLVLANGAIIGFAGLGALFSILPAQLLLEQVTWNAMFLGLAVITVLVAAVLWFVAPEHPDTKQRAPSGFVAQLRGYKQVITHPVFIRLAPMSILGQGVWLSYQGLWAGVWLREVNRLDATTVAACLLLFAVCVVAGNLILGFTADRLARGGYSAEKSMAGACFLFIAVQCVIWANPGGFTMVLWGGVGLFVAGVLFAYALISRAVPANLVGRACSLLNLLATLAGFVMQSGVGAVIELWRPDAQGIYPEAAHQTAFGVIILCQILALVWLALPVKRLSAPAPRPPDMPS
ncbi:MAG: MFS transporter [Gammaproteobacteria bacterium]|nr:MFS transporter [Gammaproteobacteria bacterium]